ncbi:phage integrase N-terminal SAM-like domain-containing protein [Candidatus Nitrotoga arctica]|uniref:phage integrase N-terminal SAM-like domain-containing protein n=1 Tax=Candidatus Nitrotoga arctica TaxID=453162 RepID=UPI003B967E1B
MPSKSAISCGSSITASALMQTYFDWIKCFIFFHDKRHPKNLGARNVEVFLTQLAGTGKISASTQG